MGDIPRKILKLLEEIVDKIQRLCQATLGILESWVFKMIDVTGSIASWVRAVIDWIRRGIDMVVQEIKLLVENPGDADTLIRAANNWVSTIGSAMGEQSQALAASKLRVDDYWQGFSADAYKESIPEQQDAFNAFRDSLVSHIQAGLITWSKQISSFWITIIAGLASFMVLIISGTVLVCAVVSLVPGVSMIVGAIGALIGVVAAAIVEMNSAEVDSISEFSISQGLVKKWPIFATS